MKLRVAFTAVVATAFLRDRLFCSLGGSSGFKLCDRRNIPVLTVGTVHPWDPCQHHAHCVSRSWRIAGVRRAGSRQHRIFVPVPWTCYERRGNT